MNADAPNAAFPARAPRARSSGFTLIELMIVVTIVGILAAIAIPSYQRFDVRTKVSEAHSLARSAQLAVADAYLLAGEFPSDNAAAGLAPPESLSGRYVSSVTVLPGGVVRATFGASPIEGETLSLRPQISGVVRWVCTSSLPVNYLPSGCTSENAEGSQDAGEPPDTATPPDNSAGADPDPFDADAGGGQGNGQNNGQGNGQGNGQNNGQNNGQSNGQNNGQGNGQNNGQNNGQGNGQNNGQGNSQGNGNGAGPSGGAQGTSGGDGGWYNDGLGGDGGEALGGEDEGEGRGDQGANFDRGSWGRASGNAAFGSGQTFLSSFGAAGPGSSAGGDSPPDENEPEGDDDSNSGRRFFWQR